MRTGPESPVHSGRRVVLVGMMGSGKTTVGRLLAGTTGWPYVDNDELLARVTGETPRDLLTQEGEEQMRAEETKALRLALRQPPPAIVSVAAGTILDKQNRDLLKPELVVWLRGRPETLDKRAVGAVHRPWLAEDPLAWIKRAVEVRDPLYRSVADLIVDVDEATPDQTAAAILDWFTTVS